MIRLGQNKLYLNDGRSAETPHIRDCRRSPRSLASRLPTASGISTHVEISSVANLVRLVRHVGRHGGRG